MNINQILKKFPTRKDCVEHLERVRWGGKPFCPYCQSFSTIRRNERHYCYSCNTSFSVTVRTIFHHTHMPLQKWLLAISLILNARRGISALQLSRDLDVNKNTAWRIAIKIREVMGQRKEREFLTAVIGIDET